MEGLRDWDGNAKVHCCILSDADHGNGQHYFCRGAVDTDDGRFKDNEQYLCATHHCVVFDFSACIIVIDDDPSV